MFESRLLKLNGPRLSGWQTLRRWRWWVAISCGVFGVLIEWLEHRLELHVDVIELAGYGLVLPVVIWWLMTHLAGALADRADTAASQLQHQQVIEQLDKHYGWHELLSFAKAMQKSFTTVSRMLQCRTTISLATCVIGAWLPPAAL